MSILKKRHFNKEDCENVLINRENSITHESPVKCSAITFSHVRADLCPVDIYLYTAQQSLAYFMPAVLTDVLGTR